MTILVGDKWQGEGRGLPALEFRHLLPPSSRSYLPKIRCTLMLNSINKLVLFLMTLCIFYSESFIVVVPAATKARATSWNWTYRPQYRMVTELDSSFVLSNSLNSGRKVTKANRNPFPVLYALSLVLDAAITSTLPLFDWTLALKSAFFFRIFQRFGTGGMGSVFMFWDVAFAYIVGCILGAGAFGGKISLGGAPVGGLLCLFGYCSYLHTMLTTAMSKVDASSLTNKMLVDCGVMFAVTITKLHWSLSTAAVLVGSGVAAGWLFGPVVKKKRNYVSKRAPTGDGALGVRIGKARVQKIVVLIAGIVLLGIK